MISKDTFKFINARLKNASQGELLGIRDKLEELSSNPIAHFDKEMRADISKCIRQVNDEIDARYDLYLIEKREAEKKPSSASVGHLYPRRTAS